MALVPSTGLVQGLTFCQQENGLKGILISYFSCQSPIRLRRADTIKDGNGPTCLLRAARPRDAYAQILRFALSL